MATTGGIGEVVTQGIGDLLVDKVKQRGSLLDQRDVNIQGSQDGGVLQPDHATANDHGFSRTGSRFLTDVFFAQSTDGGATFLSPNVRVTTVSSNEHDCNGLFPCPFIDYGNQYGDYEGLVSFGGVSHPIWTDSRRNVQTVSGCPSGLMEEVFTATVRSAN
jgi:hypothetical protein